VSELGLTLARLGFLALLWAFVIVTVMVLRRDLRQPSDATPNARPSSRARPPAPKSRAPKPVKSQKVKGSKLVVTEGPLTGTVIPLTTEQVTIGRAPDSTVVVDDDYASSRHARIYPAEGAWLVEDLGSTNGTWIDRTRVTSPTVLPVGAPLRVGRTTLQLQK
jgi:pSer/pThr/pTyr-binding forkhead associated (FHA) protein